MTPRDRLLVVTPETGLDTVLQAMAQRDIHQVPVVRNGALVGLLTRNAVIRFLQLRQALPLGADETPTLDSSPRTRQPAA
jgi:CBS domain-containing protein